MEFIEPYVNSQSLSEKTRKWLARIAPFNTHDMKFRPETSALLVIDMQIYFLDPKSPSYTCGGIAILPTIKRLIQIFRENRRPVIFTRHIHHSNLSDAGIMGWWWKGMCVEGSPESEIHPELRPNKDEKVVLKHRYSSFYNTDLETVLRVLKVEDLVITGIMTNMCCETTARDAYTRDYRVFFLADATGTINEEMHVASLLNLGYGFASVLSSLSIEKSFSSKK